MRKILPTISACGQRVRLTIALSLVAGTCAFQAAATALVDIGFHGLLSGQTPPLLGNSVPTNLPSDQLVGINFGTVVVTNGIPGMDGPVLHLQPTNRISPNFNYSQPVVYRAANIPSTATRFIFTLDFFLSGFQKRTAALRSVDELGVLFDLPGVQRIDFTTDGSIGRVSVGIGIPNYVGTFAFDQPHQLTIDLDLQRRVWSAWLDGHQLLTNRPGGGNLLSSLRINLVDDGTLPNVPLAYIDNLRLIEFSATPMVFILPDATEAECGKPHLVSALVGHGSGKPLDLVWFLSDMPLATNSIPAGTPPNFTRVELPLELASGQNCVSLKAYDADGETTSAETTITSVDTTPPIITSVAASPSMLWPPNGKMVSVKFDALTEDSCSTAAWGVIEAYSNEQMFDQADIQIINDAEVELRSRRSGRFGDRIYTVVLQAVDAAGNLSEPKAIQVTVPHDARENHP